MPSGEGGNHPIYFHVVFTLPTEVTDIAWQNKTLVYDLLFRAASETMMTIAADPGIWASGSASRRCSIHRDRPCRSVWIGVQKGG
jgi:hypothetical protein